MTARQQLARLLPLALLVVLAIAGLRGAVAGPRWNGPLRADGAAIGLALEVVFGVLLVITIRRDGAASRSEAGRVSRDADGEVSVPAALRLVLKWVLAAGMLGVGALLIANLHLHWFSKLPAPHRLKAPALPSLRPSTGSRSGAGSFPVPVGPILYGLLIAALIAAVAVSIWWAARQRHTAMPRPGPADIAEDPAGLREAVESGRAALAGDVDDARAAIIGCYLAMEATLAERGTARGVADTPDELLGRAVRSGLVRGAAARRLTALFYEARYSSHPLDGGQRAAASRALDELAAELEGGGG